MENKENEQLSYSIFEDEQGYQEIERDENTRAIKKAKTALMIGSIIILFSEMIGFFNSDISFSLNLSTVIFVIVFPLALFIISILINRSKPYLMIRIGLTTYILYILAVVTVHVYISGWFGLFTSLWSGALLKATILYFLIKALPKAKKMEHYYNSGSTI